MLFSKNLINQDKSIKSYNNFVRQINSMQQQENRVITKSLDETNELQNNLKTSIEAMLLKENTLLELIKTLEILVYYQQFKSTCKTSWNTIKDFYDCQGDYNSCPANYCEATFTPCHLVTCLMWIH